MNKPRELDASLLEALRALLGDRVTTARGVREHHGKDESYYPYAAPDAVVFPHTTEEVRDIVNICRRHRTPMIPYGVGTSLEGHVLASAGRRLRRHVADEQGARRARRRTSTRRCRPASRASSSMKHIRHTGLLFPVDPGADATLGGMAATRASGTNAVRYGTMRENVLSLTVVTGRRPHHPDLAPRAEVRGGLRPDAPVRRRRKARSASSPKSRCGSTPFPEAMSAAVCSFDDLGRRSQHRHPDASRPACRSRAARRLRDDHAARSTSTARPATASRPRCSSNSTAPRPACASRPNWCRRSPSENGGMDFEWATQAEDRNQPLAGAPRRLLRLPAADARRARGVHRRVRADLAPRRVHGRDHGGHRKSSSMPVPLFGHVGDGNFHCMFLVVAGQARRSSPKRRRSTSAWSTARWRWKAPAPASTASARARSSRSRRSRATPSI